MRIGALWMAVVIGALAGCHKPAVPPLAGPGTSACGDPCAAMVCPAGMRCTWSTSCHAHCEPQAAAPPFGR